MSDGVPVMTRSEPISCKQVCSQLRQLGVSHGDIVMVHASLKAIGPVTGGPAMIVQALCDAVGADDASAGGTIMAYVSWDRAPYEQTLGDRLPTPKIRDAWPAFDPSTAGTYRGFGVLNAYIVAYPDSRRSAHPEASIAAVGREAGWLVADHRLDAGYGPGSPLEKLVQRQGKVLLLGAPADAVTVLHYAEAIADIPGKRMVAYRVPVLDEAGAKVWRRVEEFSTNGILECYDQENGPDAVELITRDYIAQGRGGREIVGRADCHLFEAADIVGFGKAWLEARHG